jgi:hypothetical protein
MKRRCRGKPQRDDRNCEAERALIGRQDGAGWRETMPGLAQRHHMVDTVDELQGDTVKGEDVLQRRDNVFALQRLAGPGNDGALDARVDDVIEVQGVAENDVDYLANVGIREVETDAAIIELRCLSGSGRTRANQGAGPGIVFRLGEVGCRLGRLDDRPAGRLLRLPASASFPFRLICWTTGRLGRWPGFGGCRRLPGALTGAHGKGVGDKNRCGGARQDSREYGTAPHGLLKYSTTMSSGLLQKSATLAATPAAIRRRRRPASTGPQRQA